MGRRKYCSGGTQDDAFDDDFAGGVALRHGADLWRDHPKGRRDRFRLVQRRWSRARHLFLSQEHGVARAELSQTVPRAMINCKPIFAAVLSIPEPDGIARVASYRLHH